MAIPTKVAVNRVDGPLAQPGIWKAEPLTIRPVVRPKPLQKSILVANALLMASEASLRKRNPMRTVMLPINLKSARG